ncbi:MAG: ARPP-1 family domain-containing protein [Gemmatimonadota bacterium]
MNATTLELIPAASQRHENLTVFPLTTPRAAELPYRLLADAVADGTLTIAEVGGGSVPELLAVNDGEEAVLVLDGEQLIGAKQNRTPNRTVLLPPRSRTKISVSCMEQGRWRFESRFFRAAPQHSPSKVRRKTRELEAERVRAGEAARPESLFEAQMEVWAEISGMAADLGLTSATGALDSVYRTREGDLGAWAERFPPVRDQVGLLAFVGRAPLGLDVVGGRRLYGSLHQRLLRGYVLEALWAASKAGRAAGGATAGGATTGGPAADGVAAGDSPLAGWSGEAGRGGREEPGADESAALRYLDAVQKATRTETPTVGLGAYRVLSGAVVGAELEDESRLVHRTAFPADNGSSTRARGLRYY